MKLTHRDLELDRIRQDLYQAAPVILLLVVIGLVVIMMVWGRP